MNGAMNKNHWTRITKFKDRNGNKDKIKISQYWNDKIEKWK